MTPARSPNFRGSKPKSWTSSGGWENARRPKSSPTTRKPICRQVGRRLAPTTIRTVLANLRKKGYLKPVPTIERGFRLRPTVERDSVVRRTLKSLVAGLLGGSPRQAIAYLLKDENLNDADLEEIRRLVDSQRKGKRS